MGSADSESSISATTRGLLIPELMKLIEHSLRGCEKKMRIETENLEEKVYLMQRNEGLAELEKLKLEEKLQRSEKKCDRSKETINRLIQETAAKDKLILELNEKINQLKNRNVENERCVGVYQAKLKCLLKKIQDSRPKKFSSNQNMEDLRRKQFEADQNATPNIDELRRKNTGSGSSSKKTANTKHQYIPVATRAVRDEDKWKYQYKRCSLPAKVNFFDKFREKLLDPSIEECETLGIIPERVERDEISRSSFARFLNRTKHLNVWVSYANFEASCAKYEFQSDSEQRKCLQRARAVFERALSFYITCGPEMKEKRAKLLEEWLNMEISFGELGDVDSVRLKLPKKLKKRRHIETGDGPAEYEEYIDYLFPEETVQTTNLEILESEYKSKKQKI